MNGISVLSNANAMDKDFDPFDDDDDVDRDADGDEKEKDPNAMDWSPIAPANPYRQKRHLKAIGGGPNVNGQAVARKTGRWDDGSWLRPQKFFVPEEPTGLEGLFEKTISLEDDGAFGRMNGKNGKEGEAKSKWLGWVKGKWRSNT